MEIILPNKLILAKYQFFFMVRKKTWRSQMRWILLSLLTLGTLYADQKPQKQTKPACKPFEYCPVEPCTDDCDLDLFRRNCQVYSSHFEFLFWKTVATDLIYAQKMNQSAWGPDNNGIQGAYKTSCYHIEPGFRLSQSFFRATRYWELWGSYTRLTGRGSNSVSPSSIPAEFLTGAWELPFMGPLNSARSSLHLNYNVADFFADRMFQANPHLRIRMIAGLTGTWLGQNWVVNYSDISDVTARIRNAWNYWGCGMRFGMMADWFWTDDIYLTVKATLAAVMGSYHNRTRQTSSVLEPGYNSTLPIRDASYRDTRAAGNLQVMVGPSYQKNWTKTRMEFFVGYEINAWTNLQEVYHSTLGTASEPKTTWINNGYLSLHGLTSRITFDY